VKLRKGKESKIEGELIMKGRRSKSNSGKKQGGSALRVGGKKQKWAN